MFTPNQSWCAGKCSPALVASVPERNGERGRREQETVAHLGCAAEHALLGTLLFIKHTSTTCVLAVEKIRCLAQCLAMGGSVAVAGVGGGWPAAGGGDSESNAIPVGPHCARSGHCALLQAAGARRASESIQFVRWYAHTLPVPTLPSLKRSLCSLSPFEAAVGTSSGRNTASSCGFAACPRAAPPDPVDCFAPTL